MNVRQMREHADEVRASNPRQAAMFDRFADRMEREAPVLGLAGDVESGDLLQGINGTAFLVTTTERALDNRGRKVVRFGFDGVKQHFDARPGTNLRHWPAED